MAVNELVEECLEMLTIAAQRNAGGASIINIASMYGVVSPYPHIYREDVPPSPVEYGPAKAGLLQVTRHLATTLGSRRIRVSAISPGPFPSTAVQAQAPEFIRRLGSNNPLGRIGQPDELVGPALFLASDAASYVTGATCR